MKTNLPSFITNLPEIKIPDSNTKGFLIQSESNQSIFFIMKAGTYVPEHAHAAQWGVIVEGEFEIIIGGEKQVYKKGDTFFLPTDLMHAGYCVTDVVSFNVFDKKDCFKVETANNNNGN